jgi:hypothetical protein
MNYSIVYYIGVIISILFIPAFISGAAYRKYIELRSFVFLLLLILYFAGMSRSAGVDMANYIYAFEFEPELIPDIGFQFIIAFYKSLGFPFIMLMLSIGAINLSAILRLARYYNLSVGLLIIFWILHIVVVRDFSQLRVSLAISLAIIGITSKSSMSKWVLYVMSISVHSSLLVFLLAYESCKAVSLVQSIRKQWLLISIKSMVVVYVSVMLPQLGFIDDRIEIYLSWNEEGYGAEVTSFGSLILHALIVLFSVFFYSRWSNDHRLRTIFYMEILGIVTFISFSNYAIFAFRLSSLVFSLYPVLILSIIKSVEMRHNKYSTLLSLMLLWFFTLILILRPGSVEIINLIQM